MKKYQFLKLTAAIAMLYGAMISAHADTMEVIDLQNIEPVIISDGQPKAYVSPLLLNASAMQPSYRVNEPIHFNVNPSQDAYIYVLSNEPSGRTLLLYPSRIEKNNYVRANTNQVVPSINSNQSILFADKAGLETFTIIASKTPLDIADLFKVLHTGYMTASTDDVQTVLAQYGIKLGSDIEYSDNPNIALQKLHLNISGGAVQVEQPATLGSFKTPSIAAFTKFGNTLLLTIDKDSYKFNEPLTATYVATGRNYISLGVRFEDGTIKTLKTQRNNERVKQIKFAVPSNIRNVMLWESDSNRNQTMPAADASVFLDLKTY